MSHGAGRRVWSRQARSGVNHAVNLLPRKVWWEVWTPIWHEGRGPYVTVGLWLVAYYRGY